MNYFPFFKLCSIYYLLFNEMKLCTFNMADILENILTEHILVDDFKSWFMSDTSENLNDKADFIPYFLSFVKENCSWLLSKNSKALESSSKLTVYDDKSEPQVTDLSFLPKRDTASSNCEKTSSKNQYEGSDIGCENGYYQTLEQNLQDVHKSRILFSAGSCVSSGHVKRNLNERNFHTSGCQKEKCFDFNFPKNHQYTKNDQVLIPDINSYDAFPPIGSKENRNSQDSKMRRRITPTPIEVVQKVPPKFGNSRFEIPEDKVSNDVFKRSALVEMSSSNLQNEREMLKMAKTRYSQSKTLHNSFSNLRVVNNGHIVKTITTNFVIPDPDKVCHKNELNVFSVIYEIFISNGLVPNITSELFFIFELITSRILPEEKPESENNVFCSVHNCVYFAVSVLCKLKNFLHLLDNNTLTLLCEIPYLPKFSSELAKFLKRCSTEKHETLSEQQSLNRFPFIVEEDYTESFSDNHSFTSFGKQKDLFYELLKEWQQQPLDCIDSEFRYSFSQKAKRMINLAPNAINIYHLAKLFLNQLIANCLGLEVGEVYDDILRDIQKNFPGKIEKLHQRFMMPFCVGEPCPPPSFYGIQTFFSELIQAAASASLNQHLQDVFICKILELNSCDILTDKKSASSGTSKQKYMFLLHTLRLVGKFLGYIHFLSYKISHPLSTNILNMQLTCRKYSVPPLDISVLLKSALENGRVILTVPWIVEYLSMVDPVSKNLAYVVETLDMLSAIYRGKYTLPFESSNFWFLRLIIGWLFDILNYPLKYDPIVQSITFKTNLQPTAIDFFIVVDKQLAYSCCPYLTEFRVLIYNFLNGIRKDKKGDVRKITPLSTIKPMPLKFSAKQKAQIESEQTFFSSQPKSLKRTVEFVSERIQSKIKQKIRTEVTNFKLYSVEYITSQNSYRELLSSLTKTSKKNMYVDSCILELYKKSQSKISNFIDVTYPKDIENIMSSLLSDNIKPSDLEMCCKISSRLAIGNIIDWCDKNLIFMDIKSDILNKLNHLSKGEIDAPSEDDFDFSSVLDSLREFVLQNFTGLNFSNNYIILLMEIECILNKPIGNLKKTTIVFLVVDLFMSILVHFPERCNEECSKSLISIWSLFPKDCSLENYFLSAQNIKLLILSGNLELSCKKIDVMLSELIKKKIFSVIKLKDCLKTINECEWKDSKVNILLHSLFDILSKFDATSSPEASLS